MIVKTNQTFAMSVYSLDNMDKGIKPLVFYQLQ